MREKRKDSKGKEHLKDILKSKKGMEVLRKEGNCLQKGLNRGALN
jgi:hypothetical protein